MGGEVFFVVVGGLGVVVVDVVVVLLDVVTPLTSFSSSITSEALDVATGLLVGCKIRVVVNGANRTTDDDDIRLD